MEQATPVSTVTMQSCNVLNNGVSRISMTQLMQDPSRLWVQCEHSGCTRRGKERSAQRGSGCNGIIGNQYLFMHFFYFDPTFLSVADTQSGRTCQAVFMCSSVLDLPGKRKELWDIVALTIFFL